MNSDNQLNPASPNMKGLQVGFLTSFKRSQVAALIATAVDFGSLVFFVEVIKIWYVAATAMGAFLGALTNFTLGRIWSFEAKEGAISEQALKYFMVSLGSLLLNSAGVWLITEWLHFHYQLSKIVTAIAVGVFFNFPLQRWYVFKLKSNPVKI